ncbi:MAG: AsmA family protein, partial [Ignavibacteriales bacterium]|nr:AsmA family protein [Ignavibacteriales bacterium]
MALGKKAKIWIIVLSTPIVLLLAAVIGLKLYLTSDRLKALVIPKIEEATHRTVTVQDVSFSIFPSFAVSIDGLIISNPEGVKFDKENFLSLDNLRLKVNVFALLGNRLDIKYIILNRPVVYMEAREDGNNNYSLTEKKSSDETDNVKIVKGGGGTLLLSNLEIIDGDIEFVNKKSDSRLTIAGYNQTTTVESKAGERTLEISGTSSIDKLNYGTTKTWFISEQPLTGTLKMTYDIDKDILKIDDVKATLRELPLTMSGTASKLTTDEMYFDFSITSPGVQMSQVLSLVPPEMLKKASGLESSGDVKFSTIVHGTLSETRTPGVKGNFTVTNGKIKYAALPKSITGINIVGSFEKPEAIEGVKNIGKFGIEKFEATLGTNKIEGKLSVSDFDDPRVGAIFAGSMNLGEVKEFYPLERGTKLTGLMTGNVSIEGKAMMPQNIKANGKVEFRNVTMKTVGSPKPLSNLFGVIIFNNQLIESKQLAMNIGESDLSIGFVVKNYL